MVLLVDFCHTTNYHRWCDKFQSHEISEFRRLMYLDNSFTLQFIVIIKSTVLVSQRVNVILDLF
jgi:hypothetical protein